MIRRNAGAGRNQPRGGDRQPDPVGAPLRLALERTVNAPGIARAAISELCDRHGVDGSLRKTLLLLVSEVVSNAVLHSSAPTEAPIVLSATVAEQAVRISVTDSGEGFTPGQRDPARSEGGYGLYLLERAASRWGVEASGSTSVWFELDLPD